MRIASTTVATIVLAGVAAGAHADCKPVLDAYAKAEASKRYALYDVATIDGQPKGKPFYVDIDGTGYTDFGKGDYRNAGNGQARVEAGMLKDDERAGNKRCEPLGDRSIGGEAATGYKIRGTESGKLADITATHIWISKSTGLPVFHGMGSGGGGLHWVFGASVVAPPMAKK